MILKSYFFKMTILRRIVLWLFIAIVIYVCSVIYGLLYLCFKLISRNEPYFKNIFKVILHEALKATAKDILLIIGVYIVFIVVGKILNVFSVKKGI